MKAYAIDFMTELGFDAEAIEVLSADLEKILSNTESESIYTKYVALYEENVNLNYGEMLSEIDKAAELVGVHKYSAELLIFISLAKHLRELYKEKEIPDRIWFDSMCDLKWKLWGLVSQKGFTLIPLSLYFSGKNVKVEVGLCRGKKLYDKRDALAEKQANREMDRRMKDNSKGYED